MEYLNETELELAQVAEQEFQEQYEHYVGFLHWLKAGNHLNDKKEKLPSNKTCNAYGHKHTDTTIKYLNIVDDQLMEASDQYYAKHSVLYDVEKLL